MKDLKKLESPPLWVNILLAASVFTYFFSIGNVFDALGYPESAVEKLPFILVWIGAHFTIGWASAAHAWNGLLDTLDTAIKPLGWEEDNKTKHQEKLDSFIGIIWGTRLTVLIVLGIFAFFIAVGALTLLMEGYLSERTLETRRGSGLLITVGLFAFASWVFLNSRLSQYYTKIRPAINRAQIEESGRSE
jgi:hypothetical protein